MSREALAKDAFSQGLISIYKGAVASIKVAILSLCHTTLSTKYPHPGLPVQHRHPPVNMKTAAVASSLVAMATAASCGVQTQWPKSGPSTYPTTMFAGLPVIDTPMVREVRALVEKFDPFLYKHVARTWLYGVALMEANATLKAEVDVEAHAIATLMHDMGWDMTPNSPWIHLDTRFEVDGLMGLRKFVTESPNGKDFDWWRLEQMTQGIRLHGNMNLQVQAAPTVQHIVTSIQLDNPGQGYQGIGNKTLNTIFETLPNTDIAAGANETFTWLCVLKPDYTYGTIEEQFGAAFVPGYNATGHHAFDYITNAVYTNESYVPRPVNDE